MKFFESLSIITNLKEIIREKDKEIAELKERKGYIIYEENKLSMSRLYSPVNLLAYDDVIIPGQIATEWRGMDQHGWRKAIITFAVPPPEKPTVIHKDKDKTDSEKIEQQQKEIDELKETVQELGNELKKRYPYYGHYEIVDGGHGSLTSYCVYGKKEVK